MCRHEQPRHADQEEGLTASGQQGGITIGFDQRCKNRPAADHKRP
uniref:Uncharacterized protein n=1 Tax=Siphoviridae sp. ctR5S1 TaxID=2825498 RepID=A0A8S5PZA6_9CAUD|nr:MAG TPA: hypothetical protein [Siphoviridae sp. ctR5S1]DAQ79542.1 MAG TPA: hypothetical protein [Caudoviricetes sp.]